MPRKPTELLLASGTYRPDRHAQRRAAPKSDRGIGDPPPELDACEAGCWREMADNMPPGVLTSADRWTLEAAARLQAKSRRIGLLPAEIGHLRGFLVEMGGTPAARGRVLPVGAAEAPEGNPWDLPGRA